MFSENESISLLFELDFHFILVLGVCGNRTYTARDQKGIDNWNLITYCLRMVYIYLFQRATLAEKEVSALKEQLAATNQGDPKMAAVTQGNDDLVNRSSIELELSAKDKEVSLPKLYL